MIWFDLENSPHVPLFRPIMKKLDEWGIDYRVTARDYAQTKTLLDFWKTPYTLIGTHGGKSKIRKVLKLIERSSQLKKAMSGNNVRLAVSHGSRGQVLAARRMGIRSLVMLDYEYTEIRLFNTLATYLLIPALIPDERLRSAGFNLKKVIRYDGFKEELYLSSFVPDPQFRREIGIREDQVLVVIRPPGMVGNYHDSKSEGLLLSALDHFSAAPNAVCLIVHKTEKEKDFILSHLGAGKPNIRFQEKPVDGLQLLYHADIAVSGGGTMNREAALLGTETYSIFTARRPYLDEFLASQGKLRFITSNEEFAGIDAVRKPKTGYTCANKNIVTSVTTIIKEKAISL